MAKIGRNDKCPCRSGKKFKHCCAGKAITETVQSQEPLTLMSQVRLIQEDAQARRTTCREVGVFFFYSTAEGDGWLLEMTEQDALQLARQGELLEAPIDEGPQTIEINYSHRFAIDNKQLLVYPYNREDAQPEVLGTAPCRELHAALRRIQKKIAAGQLQNVHLPNAEGAISS
jgi:SEC-C motif